MTKRAIRQPRVDYDGTNLVSSHGTHHPVRVVLHDTESHDSTATRDLQGIANYWHNSGTGYGAHVGINVRAQSAIYVKPTNIAWHVANRNTGSLGIEQIGYASFPLKTWYLRLVQLEKTARWICWWNREFGIPLVISTEAGISTHHMQSLKYGGSHYDPGAGYPLNWVLRRAIQLKKLGGWR